MALWKDRPSSAGDKEAALSSADGNPADLGRRSSDLDSREARPSHGVKASSSYDSVFLNAALNRLRGRRASNLPAQGVKSSNMWLRWLQPWKWRRWKAKRCRKCSVNGGAKRPMLWRSDKLQLFFSPALAENGQFYRGNIFCIVSGCQEIFKRIDGASEPAIG
ncbi:hypothetical protein TTRE_0000500201 [Trichuris trichiura]|uniref:Uncharacterized protein n=1 Tax=Trichuris trichiura TaxID=36087 RepID=A0A077ZDJ4_TRITR|nr:hypothetical protein TTRE_0000500201 [Trichuris trichiura]